MKDITVGSFIVYVIMALALWTGVDFPATLLVCLVISGTFVFHLIRGDS